MQIVARSGSMGLIADFRTSVEVSLFTLRLMTICLFVSPVWELIILCLDVSVEFDCNNYYYVV